VLPPGTSADRKETSSDALVVASADAANVRAYWAGFAWDRASPLADAAAWGKTVDAFAARLAAPMQVSIAPGPDAKPWSVRMADSEMGRHPGVFRDRWHYETGLVLLGMTALYEQTRDRRYFDYVKQTIDSLVAPDGSIKGYSVDEYNLDQINAGKVLFPLLAEAKDEASKARYKKAIEQLRTQLAGQPRTREGGFWHKKIYPHQMWLDGLYMAEPFLAEYARTFAQPALFDEVAKQFLLIERHTRDNKTGLLFHGWDESKEQRWANPRTGASPVFWGRSMGWYAMALVDVLDRMPETHPKRAALLGVLGRLAAALAAVQDVASGVWWQVSDAPRRGKNFREASASSMFCYALAKAVNRGWLDAARYRPIVQRGYRSILSRFVRVDPTGVLNLESVATAVGLGGKPYRDGSFEYYTTVPVETNDAKGTGAFLLASIEIAKLK
jgi:unsaturated rhamnogalacturonyl hydrolase